MKTVAGHNTIVLPDFLAPGGYQSLYYAYPATSYERALEMAKNAIELMREVGVDTANFQPRAIPEGLDRRYCSAIVSSEFNGKRFGGRVVMDAYQNLMGIVFIGANQLAADKAKECLWLYRLRDAKGKLLPEGEIQELRSGCREIERELGGFDFSQALRKIVERFRR